MKQSLGAKTIVFPTPVFIIGSYNADGQPNLMNVAWGGICCSQPPCIAISIRPATATYGNIVKSQGFTVNIPSVAQVEVADYVGMCSGRDGNKFEATGLTPVKSELANAPYVDEFPLVLECRVIHAFEIGLHTQFIGEILDVKAEESVLDEKGFPDVTKLKPLCFAPSNQGYYAIGEFVGQAFSIGRKG